MNKLKLGVVESDKPVSVNVRFPAPVYRGLQAYAEAHAKETQQPKVDIRKLVVPMVVHFLENDRGFAKVRKSLRGSGQSATTPRDNGSI